jgi:predicted kinase
MAEAVIFVGLQGAGKTTYFLDHFAATHVHVSRDLQKTAAAESALVQECLRAGKSFVIDDTNATRKSREAYVRDAKTAGFRVIAVFFDTPVRTAIGRNNHRKDKKPIPVPAILRTAKQLEKPAIEEGFDEIRNEIRPSP